MIHFDYLQYDPWPNPNELLDAYVRSSQTTKAVIDGLRRGQELVGLSDNLNPPHWEFGHLTWFQEFWVHRHGVQSSPSLLPNSDVLFNSSEILHDNRWKVQLPSLDVLKKYFSDVTERSCAMLQSGTLTPEQAYFLQLALFHQDMHNEAFAYMWQFLAYEWPFAKGLNIDESKKEHLESSYIDMPTHTIQRGSAQHSGFIFDNEKWQHEVVVPHFSISSHAVNNGQYLEFIEEQSITDINPITFPPLHWKKEGHQWYVRSFDQWLKMDMRAPVRHISAIDAQKYCLWRGVRLPTENELTAVMLSSPANWQHSKLWEWTSSPFMPFAGFSPDPYKDYSAPWFDGKHRVLKGWSIHTPEYLRRPQFRNFYLPSRSDPFCGFRTCLI
jgi:EgtB-related family protein